MSFRLVIPQSSSRRNFTRPTRCELRPSLHNKFFLRFSRFANEMTHFVASPFSLQSGKLYVLIKRIVDRVDFWSPFSSQKIMKLLVQHGMSVQNFSEIHRKCSSLIPTPAIRHPLPPTLVCLHNAFCEIAYFLHAVL